MANDGTWGKSRQVLGGIGAALVLASADAATIYTASDGGTVVSLTDEPCKLPVSNLPYRAIWVEQGKKFEGCFGIANQIGMVMFYWDDKSVIAIPSSLFKRAVNL